MTYVVLAGEYMATLGGEEEKRRFHQARKGEFADGVRNAQSAWFPDAKVEVRACEGLVAATANGDMDLAQNPEFYPILQQIKSDVDALKRQSDQKVDP